MTIIVGAMDDNMTMTVAGALGTDGMSIDEVSCQQAGQVRYKIRGVTWRSAELRDFLRALDAIHLSTHFTPAGKRLPGTLPRVRYTPKVQSFIQPDPPPLRLPKNFYDDDWLRTLTPRELDRLCIQPAVKLEIPAELQRSA